MKKRSINVKENVIYTKSFDFTIQIINLYKSMCTNKEYVLSKQLLRSGTRIGANISEARNPQGTYLKFQSLYLV